MGFWGGWWVVRISLIDREREYSEAYSFTLEIITYDRLNDIHGKAIALRLHVQ